MFINFKLVTFSVLFLVTIGEGIGKKKLSCLGKTGKKADWFIIYKLPKVKESPHTAIKNGLGMLYMDSRSPRWRILKQSAEDYNQPLAYTLNQMYSRVNYSQQESFEPNDLAYALYNDRTPKNKLSSSKAHAKGAFFADKKSGFWLVHSVPAFPPAPYKTRSFYDYPSSGDKYGQIFLCLSIPRKSFDDIGTYLQYINPQVYGKYIGRDFVKSSPELWKFIRKNKKVLKRNKSYENIQKLETMSRNQFLLFSKSKHFKKDLYDGLVAPALHTNLLTETWLNGDGDYASVCRKNHSVKNILKLKVLKMSFLNSQDHSKWSVSDKVDPSKVISEEIIENRKVLDHKFQQELNQTAFENVKKYGYNSIAPEKSNKGGILDDFSPLSWADNYYKGITRQTTAKPVEKNQTTKTTTKKKMGEKKKKSSRKRRVKKKVIKKIDGFEVKKDAAWICVGDINRQRSQSKRGGGSVCFNNPRAWKAFHDMVVRVEKCSNK